MVDARLFTILAGKYSEHIAIHELDWHIVHELDGIFQKILHHLQKKLQISGFVFGGIQVNQVIE